MTTSLWTDRRAAGRALAERLAEQRWPAPVVLGLARGGVPVAYEVAATLGAPLGVLVVRKIGWPSRPEFGVGAVTADDPPRYDERSLRMLGLTEEDLRADCAREQAEARRRVDAYEHGRRPVPLEGRDVLVCDDGLATGVSARAALRHVARRRPRTVVLAVPVCAPDAARVVGAEADAVYCLSTPESFRAVGQFYRDFEQVTDRDVRALLDAAERDPRGPDHAGTA